MCPCFKFVSGFLKIHSLKRHLVLMGKTKTMSKNLIWICSKEQIRLNVMIPLKGYITISEIRSSKKSKLKIQDVTHLIKLLHDKVTQAHLETEVSILPAFCFVPLPPSSSLSLLPSDETSSTLD